MLRHIQKKREAGTLFPPLPVQYQLRYGFSSAPLLKNAA